MGVVYIILAGLGGVLVHFLTDSVADYATLFASVIVLYYLFMYMHMSKIDTLTGLMNRQSFYHDTSGNLEGITAVCSADMNELKWINDNFGHEAGDLALKTVAECLMESHDMSKHVYRVGGDEFVILYFNADEAEVQKDIEAMREALSQTQYVCAFGYCMMNKQNDFEKIMVEADGAMYANKAEIKRAVLASGGELHERTED